MRASVERAQAMAGWMFAAPALALIGIFFFVPVTAGLVLSLTDFDIYAIASPDTARFVGLANFAAVLSDPVFWTALRNTMFFVLVGGPLTVAVSLAAAVLVNSRLARAPGFFRSLYFTPVVTTLVAMSVVFRYLYHPHYGLLNHALGLVGIGPIDWLGDPRWAMPALILFAVWKNFGYAAVIFVAGLQNVPEELYEAARIDGAGPVRQFRHVTLPELGPTFVFVGVITAIGFLQAFAEPYVLTPEGGPLNATITIVMLMYREGFRWWNMGYAAAVAFVLFALVLLGTLAQRLIRRMR